jgi:hypothetical protein
VPVRDLASGVRASRTPALYTKLSSRQRSWLHIAALLVGNQIYLAMPPLKETTSCKTKDSHALELLTDITTSCAVLRTCSAHTGFSGLAVDVGGKTWAAGDAGGAAPLQLLLKLLSAVIRDMNGAWMLQTIYLGRDGFFKLSLTFETGQYAAVLLPSVAQSSCLMQCLSVMHGQYYRLDCLRCRVLGELVGTLSVRISHLLAARDVVVDREPAGRLRVGPLAAHPLEALVDGVHGAVVRKVVRAACSSRQHQVQTSRSCHNLHQDETFRRSVSVQVHERYQ